MENGKIEKYCRHRVRWIDNEKKKIISSFQIQNIHNNKRMKGCDQIKSYTVRKKEK